MFRHISVAFALCLLLTGCDLSLFTPTATTGGQVVITNRFTGTTSQIKDGVRFVIPEKQPTNTQAIDLPATDMGNIPFSAVSAIKYADDKMLLKFSVSPQNSDYKRLAEWRDYVFAARLRTGAPTFNLQFLDSDGFVRFTQFIAIDGMRQTVDRDGNTLSLNYEAGFDVSATTFSSIVGWSIGWSGNWATWPIKIDAPANSSANPQVGKSKS